MRLIALPMLLLLVCRELSDPRPGAEGRPPEGHRFLWVYAVGGLVLRSTPSQASGHLALIPNGARVSAAAAGGRRETIAGRAGQWVPVVWSDKRGFAFSVYLSELPFPTKCFGIRAYAERYLTPHGAPFHRKVPQKSFPDRDEDVQRYVGGHEYIHFLGYENGGHVLFLRGATREVAWALLMACNQVPKEAQRVTRGDLAFLEWVDKAGGPPFRSIAVRMRTDGAELSEAWGS